MKVILLVLLVTAILLAITSAASVGDGNQLTDDCTISNCSKYCQKIGYFGGNCIFGICKCYDI